MTDWLIAQQGVLSTALLFLLFAERFLTKRMGDLRVVVARPFGTYCQ